MIMLGSIPFSVHDDEDKGFGSDGQSPARWWLLVQFEQEIDTSTGPDDGSRSGSFHM